MPAPFFDSEGDEQFTLLGTVDPIVGKFIGGRYRVDRRLGAGGMGVVYAAEHVDLQRPVAIKVIRPEAATNRVGVERFHQEARTAGKLGHPNIVDVFDLGRLDDGRPFMVMPLLRGMDFEEVLHERGPLAPARVAQILAGAASGLDAMHAQGLVHRDIKPANIFMAVHDDGGSTTLVMDFGLAALQHMGSRMTAENIVIGTPTYIPPECVTGEKMGVPGDIYCLAVVAYELISGRLPFESDNGAHLLAQKIAMPAPPLSQMTEVASPALDAFFARALSRTPSDRPTSCGDLVNGLAEAAAKDSAETDVARSAAANPGTSELEFRFSEPPALVPASKRPTTPPPPSNDNLSPVDGGDLRYDASEVLGVRGATGNPEGDNPVLAGLTDETPTLPQRSLKPLIVVLLLLVLGGVGAYVSLSSPATEMPPPGEPLAELTPSVAAESERLEEPVDVVPEPANPEDAVAEEVATPTAMTPTAMTPTAMTPTAMTLRRVSEGVESLSMAAAMLAPAPEAPSMEPVETAMEAELPAAEARMRAEAPGPDRDRAAALTREANGLALRGLIPQAIDRLREATLAAPRYAPAWRSLGIAQERLGRTAEARRAFARYLRIAPGAADAGRIRARLDAL